MNIGNSEKILIIDDNIENLDLLDTILGKEGYRIFSFPRADLALKGALKNPPDLIILDINMPHINGFSICKTFKSNDTLCDIPIIFISGCNHPAEKEKAYHLGGDDFITKPFVFKEILYRVKTHLQLKRYQEYLTGFGEEVSFNISKFQSLFEDLRRCIGMNNQAALEKLDTIHLFFREIMRA